MKKVGEAHYRAELRQVEKKISKENESNEQKPEQSCLAANGDKANMEKANQIPPHSTHNPAHPEPTGQRGFVQVGAHLVWPLTGKQQVPLAISSGSYQ